MKPFQSINTTVYPAKSLNPKYLENLSFIYNFPNQSIWAELFKTNDVWRIFREFDFLSTAFQTSPSGPCCFKLTMFQLFKGNFKFSNMLYVQTFFFFLLKNCKKLLQCKTAKASHNFFQQKYWHALFCVCYKLNMSLTYNIVELTMR